MNFKSIGAFIRKYSRWGGALAASVLLASPSFALTAGAPGPVVAITNGACTSASPTSFGITIASLVGVDADHAIGDVYSFYWVDGNGTILFGNWGSVAVGTTNLNIGPFDGIFSVTPATGPFRFVLLDDTSPGAQVAGGTLVENNVLIDVAFDANALNSDCPVGAPVVSDTTDPTVTISGVPANSNAPFTATFTFDEDITGFDLSDITAALDNATASNFATILASRTFSALITPTAAGTVTVGVDAAAAKDLANNDNEAAIDATSEYDGDRPSVQILGAPSSLNDLTPFSVTIQFNEDVTGFLLSDVTIINATLSNFVALDGDTYTILVTPSGAGDVTIDVAAAVAIDAATNPNTAAVQVVVGNTIVSDTSRLINDFTTNRARQIILSQPDLVDRLSRGNGGGGSQAPLGFSASGDLNNYALSFSTSLDQLSNPALDELSRMAPDGTGTSAAYSPFDVWIDGSFAHADTGTSDASSAAAHFGMDYLLTPDLLVGVMGQLDWTSQQDLTANTAADGLGWMFGPYVVARLNEHLFFDATVLGGQSYNHINPLGLYVDSFDTQRWLVRAKLTGEFTMDEWTFSPFISSSFFSETQNAYVDSLSNAIPAQTISHGSLAFGPRVSYLIEGDGVSIEPSVGLIGSWNFSTNGSGVTYSDWAARLEGGIDFRLDGGATLNSKAFYDGIGVSNRQAYGANAGLRIPMN